MKQKKYKVILSGYCSGAQRGDAAIMMGTIKALRKYLHEPEFTIFCDAPEFTVHCHDVSKVYRQPFVTFKWDQRKNLLHMLYLLWAAPYIKRGVNLPKTKSPFITMCLEADIIISKGGSFFSDFYVPGIYGRIWFFLFAKRLGKVVCIYGQSIGPVENKLFRWLIKKVFSKLDVITLRDQYSVKLLAEMGVVNDNIYYTADGAFALEKGDKIGSLLLRRREEANAFKIQAEKNLKVSISVRHWKVELNDEQSRNYLQSIKEACSWLVKNHGAQIVFASTCTSIGNYKHDDRMLALDLINGMDEEIKSNIKILTGEYSPIDLIDFYSIMDLHIGTRMHSNILALIAGTPVMAIEYEFKTRELMKSIDLEEYLLSMNNMTGPGLIEKIDNALDHLDDIQNKVSNGVVKLRKKSFENAEIIASYVNKNNVNK